MRAKACTLADDGLFGAGLVGEDEATELGPRPRLVNRGGGAGLDTTGSYVERSVRREGRHDLST